MTTLVILNGTVAERMQLQIAFNNRHNYTWNAPIERYGHHCNSIDEVLTHIAYVSMFDCGIDSANWKVNQN
jgi:hypothetical protein